MEQYEDYNVVKSSLLKRYLLSSEGFRQRFKEATKLKDESYVEFGYNLKLDFVEWLKSAKVYGDMVKLAVKCLCLEQFYSTIPDRMCLLILNRPNVTSVAKVAELVEEYMSRHVSHPSEGQMHGHNVYKIQVEFARALRWLWMVWTFRR